MRVINLFRFLACLASWRSSLLLLLLLSGCTTIVFPPAAVEEPATLFIVDYGKHSGLALPGEIEGQWIEYAYGDWRCFVENKNSIGDFLLAGVASRGAALGRREVLLRRNRPLVPQLSAWRVHPVIVERERATALRSELDARYRRGGDDPVDNPFVRLSFVRDSERYSLLNNCNHLTARWLRALGCRTRGLTMLSRFGVREAAQP